MRGTWLYIAPLALIVLPLFGCAQPADLSQQQNNQISVTGQQSTATPAGAAQLLNAGEAEELPQPAAAGPASVPGMLPFVRSKPKEIAPFPVVLNRAVQAYVDGYLAQPQGLKRSFRRSQVYMPEMTELLQQEGLPPDLVYLSFAESAFEQSGAGPWQLNKSTARRFGLEVDSWVDERRDPIKSTRAAAEYLATLHDQADQDWRMTLIGWNNGEAKIPHYLALEDASYERLVSRLPRRTRSLMNRFMAVAVIAHHCKEYGIDTADYSAPGHYELVSVPGGTKLSDLAEDRHTSLSVLKTLNPALLRDRTPPGETSYPVRLPDARLETTMLLQNF
jgi:membrane-bound lytic murein transglycosylase D